MYPLAKRAICVPTTLTTCSFNTAMHYYFHWLQEDLVLVWETHVDLLHVAVSKDRVDPSNVVSLQRCSHKSTTGWFVTPKVARNYVFAPNVFLASNSRRFSIFSSKSLSFIVPGGWGKGGAPIPFPETPSFPLLFGSSALDRLTDLPSLFPVEPHCQDLAKEEADSCLTKSTIWTYDASTGSCVVQVGCYPRVAPENNVFSDPGDCLLYCGEQ